ncbi:hypothetical protein [Magnetospirillum sulfuroxidans]|uniref:Cytochrome c domain-containing protein n=1 Tax=Magnetospirillum sulfuroxidans TaxID=611300 RepID=A0ABS5IDZ0_9PROT|nr:hypothetical protein [Magnetospirillum sulfuroxidans]MBR9972643.1 hypothetical protein [Magnetospirillum sulfuroxidans]
MSTFSRLCAVALFLVAGSARASDLHALWDGQCGGCHGHAGDFARESLEMRAGVLTGRLSGQPVTAYLVRHNGGYAADQIAELTAMLTAQAGTSADFRQFCGGCHDNAAQLVRDWVVQREGVLVGLGSGRPLSEFLRRHGGADDASRERILEALTRIQSEVNHR